MKAYEPTQIGLFDFDRKTGELTGPGRVRRLRPQSCAVLELLVACRGKLIPRNEFRRLLWPGSPGSADPALNTCIREIRSALDDPATAPRHLITVPKRGYRLETGMPLRSTTSNIDGDEPVRSDVKLPMSRSWRAASIWAACACAVAATVLGMARETGDSKLSKQALIHALSEARSLLQTPNRRAWREGTVVLDRIIAARPQHAPALADAAYANFRLGNEEESRKQVLQALEADPLLARAHLVSGLIAMYWEGDVGTAERAFSTAAQLSPDDPFNRLALGYLSATNQPLQAEPALELALSTRPASTMLLLDAAYVHYLHGSFEEMAVLCELARTRGSGRAAHRCLIDVHLARGDREAAASNAREISTAEEEDSPADVLRGYWTAELLRAQRLQASGRTGGLLALKAMVHLEHFEDAMDEVQRVNEARPSTLIHATRLPYLSLLRTRPDWPASLRSEP